MDLSELNKFTHSVLTIDSTVPTCSKDEECCVGIDEAGRGPVLGMSRSFFINNCCNRVFFYHEFILDCFILFDLIMHVVVFGLQF